jgi:hypothetical protein
MAVLVVGVLQNLTLQLLAKVLLDKGITVVMLLEPTVVLVLVVAVKVQ